MEKVWPTKNVVTFFLQWRSGLFTAALDSESEIRVNRFCMCLSLICVGSTRNRAVEASAPRHYLEALVDLLLVTNCKNELALWLEGLKNYPTTGWRPRKSWGLAVNEGQRAWSLRLDVITNSLSPFSCQSHIRGPRRVPRRESRAEEQRVRSRHISQRLPNHFLKWLWQRSGISTKVYNSIRTFLLVKLAVSIQEASQSNRSIALSKLVCGNCANFVDSVISKALYLAIRTWKSHHTLSRAWARANCKVSGLTLGVTSIEGVYFDSTRDT